MKDDELETWRREWHAQPTVPLDLIRRVERQTLYMRLDWAAQVLPALVGASTVIAAVVVRTLAWIVLASGIWVFIIVGWWFMNQNMKGTWAPVAETTAAYVGLSIERCRRKLTSLRFDMAFAVLLTAFVILMVYRVLASAGVLRTVANFMFMYAAFLLAIAAVVFMVLAQLRKRRKTESELAYLLELQRKLENVRP
jgi:hypothetical protein